MVKHFFIILLLLFLFIVKNYAETETINILFVNDNNNIIADKAVEVAIKYIEDNYLNLGLIVNVQKLKENENNSTDFLDPLCIIYEEMIANNTPPHVVFDTTKFGLVSENVKYFTATLGLPTISSSFGKMYDLRQWKKITEDEAKYLIQIKPPADITIEIVFAFVLSLNIPDAAILYDDTFIMKHYMKQLLLNFSTRYVIKAVDFNNINKQLLTLHQLDVYDFFLLGSLKTIEAVLTVACKSQFAAKLNAWHVITLEEEDITCNCDKFKILFAQLSLKTVDKISYLRNNYGLDVKPEISAMFYFDLFLQTALTINEIILKETWLDQMTYVSCDKFDPTIKPNRKNLNLQHYFNKTFLETPAYGEFFVKENGNSFMKFSMSIYSLTFSNGSVENLTQIGYWYAGIENNFTLHKKISMEQYKNKQLYKIVTVEKKPFVYIDKNSPRGFRGFCIDMIEEIARLCNFTFEIYLVSDGKIGNINQNGEWNGAVKEILDDKADIALSGITVTLEREMYIDFTIPFYDMVGITVLMKETIPSTSLFAFLRVLDKDVWLCILITYFFTSLIIWVFDRFSPYSYQNNKQKYKNSEYFREFTLKESFWFCMTSLTPQGGGLAPNNISGKLITAFWWLFGFIIIASYTANLAAFLTVRRLAVPIDTLTDLAAQYKITYAPIKNSDTMAYFEKMANIEKTFYKTWEKLSLENNSKSKYSVWEYPISDKYTKMWHQMVESGFPASREEAIKRVRNSKSLNDGFAHLGDATDLKYIAMTNCDMKVIGDEFSKKPYAIGVQKGSPLKEMISIALLKMITARKLEELKQKWWDLNPDAIYCPEVGFFNKQIRIQNIGGVFIIALIGICSACFLFIIKHRRQITNEIHHNKNSYLN